MGLSQSLLDSVTKAILTAEQTQKRMIQYGTIVKIRDNTYVRLDGSPENVLTPAVENVRCRENDRVSVEIIDRRCIINANFNT